MADSQIFVALHAGEALSYNLLGGELRIAQLLGSSRQLDCVRLKPSRFTPTTCADWTAWLEKQVWVTSKQICIVINRW